MTTDFPAHVEPKSMFLKAALDKIVVILALICSAPLMVALGIGIWSTLGRPLLFAQTRAGLGRREFTIRKFRTMHDLRDASKNLLPDEERQTSFTRWVRRLRLDELPQLISVLAGEMALVGPRPLMSPTIMELGELGRLRCSVPPGLTGWAQVNGNTKLTTRQKLALDLWYIKHQTIAFDLFVLLLTVRTLICGEKQDHQRLAVAEKYFVELSSRIDVTNRRL